MSTDQILRYDPAADSLSVLDAKLPEGRFLAGAAWGAGSAYVFGGVNHATGGIADILRLDPGAGVVLETGASLPTRREGAAAVWAKDAALVFGGARFQHGWIHLDDVVRYAPGASAAPQALVASRGPGVGEVRLEWSPPADDGGATVTSYRVMRADADGSNESVVADVTTTTFADTGLEAGVAHRYRVAATNAVGEGDAAGPVEAAPFARPGAPASVAATPGPGLGDVTIEWSPPADDGGTPVVAYNVYRRQAGGAGNGVLVAEADANATSIVDGGLEPRSTHEYRVRAVNAVDEGAASAAAEARAADVPDAPAEARTERGPGVGEVTLRWDAPADDGGLAVTAFRVIGGDAPDATTHLADVDGDAYSFVESGLPNGAERHYRVSAVNAAGEGAATSPVAGRAPTQPAAPRNATATPGPSWWQIRVDWEAPADDGGIPVAEYHVYRRPVGGGAEALVATLDGDARAFTDGGRPILESFVYRVAAANAVGEGAPSADACSTSYPWHFAPSTPLVAACP